VLQLRVAEHRQCIFDCLFTSCALGSSLASFATLLVHCLLLHANPYLLCISFGGLILSCPGWVLYLLCIGPDQGPMTLWPDPTRPSPQNTNTSGCIHSNQGHQYLLLIELFSVILSYSQYLPRGDEFRTVPNLVLNWFGSELMGSSVQGGPRYFTNDIVYNNFLGLCLVRTTLTKKGKLHKKYSEYHWISAKKFPTYL